MAIGDKIDWRAGTIDPTTLQLIASAGAAQGAMYQSLGDSVSKALEKDSEDYIVAAGKAFDKANELYDIEDGEDFNHEKYNKLTKKGINLFRKAGEKYNIISGGWESGSRLMTEEDIHKFYGFDPDRPLPRSTVPLRKKGDVSEQVGPGEGSLVEGPEEPGVSNYVEDAMAAKKPPPFQPNIEAIRPDATTELLNRLPGNDQDLPPSWENYGDWTRRNAFTLPVTGPSRDSIASELGISPPPVQTPPGSRQYGSSVRGAGGSSSSIRDQLWGLPRRKSWEPLKKDAAQWGQKIADTAAHAVIAATPKAEILSNYLDPVARQISSSGHDIHDSLVETGGEIGGYLEGAAKDTLELIQKIPYPGGELSRDTLAQMNQPVWEADSAPTTEGDYSKFENPFNPTPSTSESLVPPPQPEYFLSEEQYNLGSDSFLKTPEEELKSRFIYNPSDYR
tara:strand:+ start:1433 stop:2779 length:1347 start_codon:yes stop_codon:yes gene_type:complete